MHWLQDEFAYTGVSGEMFATEERALDERTIGHNPERLSLMKGGLVYSNAITTVSPTYAKEVLDGGAGRREELAAGGAGVCGTMRCCWFTIRMA